MLQHTKNPLPLAKVHRQSEMCWVWSRSVGLYTWTVQRQWSFSASKVIRRQLECSLDGSQLSGGDMIDWLICCSCPLWETQPYKRGWNRKSSVSQLVSWIIQPLTSLLCRVSFSQSQCELQERTNNTLTAELVVTFWDLYFAFIVVDLQFYGKIRAEFHYKTRHTEYTDWILSCFCELAEELKKIFPLPCW